MAAEESRKVKRVDVALVLVVVVIATLVFMINVIATDLKRKIKLWQ